MTETVEISITFLVLIVIFIAFVREKIGPYLVAVVGMGVLLTLGIITTQDMLSVFSNSAPHHHCLHVHYQCGTGPYRRH